MNVVKRPKEEKAVLAMQQLYLKTERKLINEITRKRALGYVDYAEVAALERVQQILTDMQNEAFEYVPQMVETIFHGEGEKNAAGYENARTLTSTQIDVSQLLINNLLGEIAEASAVAMESAANWLSIGRLEADEFRNAALKFTAEQQAMGASWTMAQKNMAVDLNARGITAFIDKAGRRWSLTDYCTMATRTTARQASVAANLTRDDHDLWQISKIGSTCPLCAVYEGRVYSKSGTDPDYPPLAAAFGKIDPAGPDDLTNTYLNLHPNCLHSLKRYTTIGLTDKQIQKDKDFSSFEKNPITHDPRTKKQIEAYREKEKNRRHYIEDRKQWNKYKAALGDEVPGFDTFRKHKEADDDKYKEWMSQFRSFRKEAKQDVETVAEFATVENFAPKTENLKDVFGKHVNFITGGRTAQEYIASKNPLYNFKAVKESDAVDLAIKDFKPWVNSLSKSEKNLINRYTYNPNDRKPKFFERINSFTRNGYQGEKDYTEQVNIISGALKRAKLDRDFVCYRGSNYNPFKGLRDGDRIKVNQFFSASVIEDAAFKGKYRMLIFAPKGTQAAFVEEISHRKYRDQHEMLFDKDVVYEVICSRGKDIVVKVIP